MTTNCETPGHHPSHEHNAANDWNEFENMADSGSSPTLANEGHVQPARIERTQVATAPQVPSILYVTEQFWWDIQAIYGGFTAQDPEYPALGITIEGAPIFVECIRFPDEAIIRRPASDEVRGDHPDTSVLWESIVPRYNGRCRWSTVHIHSMNLPVLSDTDVRRFESLRHNPQTPSTFGLDQPYPVILVNLTAARQLDLVGFWVNHGIAHRTRIKYVTNGAVMVTEAWKNARPLPYFSEEARLVRQIHQRLASRHWAVALGVNPATQAKAIKAHCADGRRVLLRFTPDAPLGLTPSGSAAAEIRLENYVDWARLFDDLTASPSPADVRGNSPAVCAPIKKDRLNPIALEQPLEDRPQQPALFALH